MDIILTHMHIITLSQYTFSTSEVRVTTAMLGFTLTSAAELDYPERVCLVASEDGSHLGLKVWDSSIDVSLSFPFVDRSQADTKKLVTIRDKSFVKALRNTLGWEDKLCRTVRGVLYKSAKMLYFDLTKATLLKDKHKQKIASLADYPRVSEVVKVMRPIALPPAMDVVTPHSAAHM